MYRNTILIIEDEENIRNYMEMIMPARNYKFPAMSIPARSFPLILSGVWSP
jgi:hypothetical protein